ncbi:hypothetical protein [Brevibacterium yomogidense]|uniref:Uncharacterized protein n=1 Tax=Brevibacterium yomogidense TaxID=946573 RepID=A0A1X6XAC1_9MICO|nr:hypothetical protein [Brevibacterium yomogidense]SLM96089.1 hypothetical protein FM105_05365 [Brevibacterium yomogidense]
MERLVGVTFESERGAARTVLNVAGTVTPAVVVREWCRAGEAVHLVGFTRGLADGPCAVWAEHLGVEPDGDPGVEAEALSRLEPDAVLERGVLDADVEAKQIAVLESVVLELRVFGAGDSALS